MIDSELMEEVMAGEFSPEEVRERNQKYTEVFGWWNVLVQALWPDLDPDAVVYEVEIDDPNITIRLGVFTGEVLAAGKMIGEPIEKMVARDFVLDQINQFEAAMAEKGAQHETDA